MAATSPTGPVFVALPMDVLDAPCSESVVPTSILNTVVAPDIESTKVLAKMLVNAAHPMIIMGDGIAMSRAQTELSAVVELLGAEVYGADNSEVNLDATHALYKGSLGHMFGSHSTPLVSEADAVLIVGTYVFPEVFPTITPVFKRGAKVAHIDLDAFEIAKNFPVDLGIVADPKLTLAALADAVRTVRTSSQAEAAATRAKALGEAKARALEGAKRADRQMWDDVPMKPARFMHELAQRVDNDVIIFDEALTSSPELNRYLPARKPGHFFQTRGGSLGVGIPGAIGLKLAHPDKTVIGFTGDGGSMYTIQALWTAAKYNIGAKFIICNNRSYKLLELNIRQYWKERGIPDHEFPKPFSLAEPPVEFVEIARGLHVDAVRVERPDEIGRALDTAFSTDAPFLIDLVLAEESPEHKAGCKCGQ
jgi:benzoylformate decarboxylase